MDQGDELGSFRPQTISPLRRRAAAAIPDTPVDVIERRVGDGENVVLRLTHPQYGHIAVVPADVREELAKDFD